MGDPQTLKAFVSWTKTNDPATNYLLERPRWATRRGCDPPAARL
jgi:hypothetical protein